MEIVINLQYALTGEIVERSEGNRGVEGPCSLYRSIVSDISLNKRKPVLVLRKMISVYHEEKRVGIQPNNPGIGKPFQQKLGKPSGSTYEINDDWMFDVDRFQGSNDYGRLFFPPIVVSGVHFYPFAEQLVGIDLGLVGLNPILDLHTSRLLSQ